MSQKRIGYLISKNSETNGLNVSGAYAAFLSNFGVVVPINALDNVVYSDLDLLVLPGGADINPSRYNAEELSYFTNNPNIQLEWWDTNMLPKYINTDIPILGICRGFQTLNVHFNGTLSQHINQSYSPKRDELVDELVIISGASDHVNFILPKSFKVNSLHHQGVKWSDYDRNHIIPLFKNKTYDNIEVFKVIGKNIYGVQYHPEEIYDNFSWNLINSLLND